MNTNNDSVGQESYVVHLFYINVTMNMSGTHCLQWKLEDSRLVKAKLFCMKKPHLLGNYCAFMHL